MYPNEKSVEGSVITEYDWQGPCFLIANFSLVHGIKMKMPQNIGARLRVSKPARVDDRKSFNVAGAYIPFHPFMKCYHYPSFALGKPHQLNFMAQAIISLVKDEANGVFLAADQDTTETAIINFVPQITASLKNLRDKYKEVFNSRKNRNRSIFWHAWLQLSVFSTRQVDC